MLTGGASGAIVVGTSGNTANILVGHTSGGNGSSGIVDFSGETSLTASLNNLYLGTAEVGTATGTLKLAASNTIDANAIRVGYSTNDANGGNNLLVLGHANTITTNEFTIAGQRSNGSLEIPAGGTLNLGTSVDRANLFIARNNINTSASSAGSADFTAATLDAYLDTVIIGDESNGGTGTATGMLTTGTTGLIDAHNITLGVGTGSGTINFNGGTIIADSIAKGTGTAQFNWAAGTLHVGTFGSAGLPFNLLNTGTGTLAPGDDPGATNVFGNYTQGASAHMQIELGGLVPGSGFDQVVVSGSATLGGHLDVSLFNGFQPMAGEHFEFLMASNVTGTFGFASLPSLPAGLSWQVDYEPTFVSLNVVPEPGSLLLAGLSLASLGTMAWRRRRERAAPTR